MTEEDERDCCDGCGGEGCFLCCEGVFAPGTEQCDFCDCYQDCKGSILLISELAKRLKEKEATND